MSAICQRFVQNAWRSDLCSNCFKSLEDHHRPSSGPTDHRGHATTVSPTARYVPQAASLYQSRGISSSCQWRSALAHTSTTSLYDRVACRDFGSQTAGEGRQDDSRQTISQRGILKDASPQKKSRRRSSVGFASEEALVIGYGGNDYDSDDPAWELGSDDGSVDLDLLDLTEEDRKVTRITKDNTEFNSFNKNLLDAKKTAMKDTNNNVNNNANNKFSNNANNTFGNDVSNKVSNEVISNNINNTSKKVDKSVLSCVTYNDIQSKTPEKKLNQYYFSTKEEPLKSYTFNSSSHKQEEARLKNTNQEVDVSIKKSDLIMNLKIENKVQNSPEKCQILLGEDYTPLNTTTYSFVSKINKTPPNSDHGSDSDYSTSRQTTGESTDSESFHDCDEVRVVMPCQSFLHGSRSVSKQTIKDEATPDFKTYDAGSSTSGDISNFSDDSDSLTSPETCVTTSATRKTSPISNARSKTTDSKSNVKIYSSDSNAVKASKTKETASKLNYKTADGNIGDVTSLGNETTVDSSVLKRDVCDTDRVIAREEGKITVSLSEKRTTEGDRREETVAAKEETCNKRIVTKIYTAPPPNKTSGITTAKLESSLTGKTEVVSSENEMRKTVDETLSTQSSEVPRSEIEETPPSTFEENLQNETDARNDRQSKLAALALELEQARREAISNPDPSPVISYLHPEVRPKRSPPRASAKATPPPDVPYSTIRRTGAVSSASKLSVLPDVLQDTKPKKARFSLKKLLKRGSKDYESPPGLDPKAWKKQSFDRSRMSLEIVHPTELANSSAESTPTEEKERFEIFADPTGRVRSLSALPYLNSGDELSHARKAGTVAERKKKSRPQLVRTPSCSALHGRSSSSSGATPQRPPKPPPPPRGSCPQAPPPPQSRIAKLATPSPARPPPPKIPGSHAKAYSSPQSVISPTQHELQNQCNLDGEYANLGDVRSLLTPKKPGRPSAVSVARDDEMGAARADDTYETLEAADEEDHYTYLDDNESRQQKSRADHLSVVACPVDSSSGQPPWSDLQASYSAIAAAIYESLADLVATATNEDMENFQKLALSPKWKDFQLESEEPAGFIEDKIIFDALHKNVPQIQVTLMVTMQRQPAVQGNRNLTRLPVLSSFSDSLPGHLLQKENTADSINVFVYVLQRSKVTTIEQFAKESTRFNIHQHIRLRNDCFVLLQLIHTLKSMQAEGIEELSSETGRILLVQTDLEKPPMLILLPGDKVHLSTSCLHKTLTLCQTTLQMLLCLLQMADICELKNCIVNGELLAEPVAHTFSAIARVLSEEKASSLSQAKGLLEHMLWGPVDVKLETESSENVDSVLKRWLDLQRAQMVKSLVSSCNLKTTLQTGLHIYEEYQLIFLLQASVKSLRDVLSKLQSK